MVATDQQKQKDPLLDELLKHLKDKDRFGNAAKGLAGQQMSTQVMPVQMGGGLLQQLLVPQMYGAGIMGGPGGSQEDKMARIMKMMQALWDGRMTPEERKMMMEMERLQQMRAPNSLLAASMTPEAQASQESFMAAREQAMQPLEAVGPAPGSRPPNPLLAGYQS